MRNALAMWLNATANFVHPDGVVRLWAVAHPRWRCHVRRAHITTPTTRQKNGSKSRRSAYCTKKITICPAHYLPPFFCLCPRSLRQVIPTCPVTIGIYVIICLSLRSIRQSLSRRQGMMLIYTNALRLLSQFFIRQKAYPQSPHTSFT